MEGRNLKWVTSGEVASRIVRNTRMKDESYIADIPEWIAEAIFKLKTRYQYELKCEDVRINFYQIIAPCSAEALSAIVFNGQRILPSASDGPLINIEARKAGTSVQDNVFHSVLCAPCGVENLDETSVNNWPEYIKSSALVETYPVCPSIRYRVNFNKIEIGAQSGVATIYYWSIPKDDTGFPMIPDMENYKTAVYWYVRAMLIGAGWQDKVFNFDYCDGQFNTYANIAMNEITYPTPDEVQEGMILSNRLVDIGTGWANFYTAAPEGRFDDY